MNNDAKPESAPALARWIPGLALFRTYRREWLAGDVLAGVSVCVIMIPSVIAYARLMGLPPQHGLYAALIPLVVYPFFGSSRQVIVGPDIAISLLMAGAIAPLAGGDPARAAMLTATLALVSGIFLLLGARAKIGAVADFLSKPVLIGYMTGAALILMASQIAGLLGIPLHNQDFFPRLFEAGNKLEQTHPLTLLLGAGLVSVIFLLRRFAPKVPAALVVCVAALGASFAFHLEQRGVAVIGPVSRGLPGFEIPKVTWHEIHSLLPAALGIALLTYTEGILLARAFGAKNNYEIQPNQELTGLGFADVLTGLFQGFAITGSQARTTVNDNAGGKTQMSSLVAAAALAAFLLFLTPLLTQLPVVALASILIYGACTLVEFEAMKRIYRFYPRAAVVAALTTLGVLAAGVVPGILFGVVLSLLGLISRVSHPPDAVLREVPGHGYHDLGDAPVGQTIPGLVAFRYYAPLLFFNCGHFTDRVRQLVATSPAPVRWFLLDAQAITDIDETAAEALHILRADLESKGVALKIAHSNRPFRAILERTGLARELNEQNFFDSVHDCVNAFQTGKVAPTAATPRSPR